MVIYRVNIQKKRGTRRYQFHVQRPSHCQQVETGNTKSTPIYNHLAISYARVRKIKYTREECSEM